LRVIAEVRQEKMKKILILSGIIVVLTVSMAGADDSGLRPVRMDLPPGSNSYTLWTKALPQLRLPEDDGLRDTFVLACNLSTNMPMGEVRRQVAHGPGGVASLPFAALPQCWLGRRRQSITVNLSRDHRLVKRPRIGLHALACSTGYSHS